MKSDAEIPADIQRRIDEARDTMKAMRDSVTPRKPLLDDEAIREKAWGNTGKRQAQRMEAFDFPSWDTEVSNAYIEGARYARSVYEAKLADLEALASDLHAAGETLVADAIRQALKGRNP
jgi:hypothetical protein